VSTSGQNLDRQTRALAEVGCIRVFADKQSGKTAARPELAACLDYPRAGDTMVVQSLGRLSRSLQDLIPIVAQIKVPSARAGFPPPGSWRLPTEVRHGILRACLRLPPGG
jgi:hypothetical protein